ncbi:hypothetical protein CBL_10094 [Carabus blaptoides fortunei]
MFNQISLQMHIDYSIKEHKIIGFVDNGTTRTNEFADHALVFMTRGIRRSWKQLVAITFCKGATRGSQLAKQIKDVRQTLFTVGLRPTATVCEQAKANVSAIDYLLRCTEDRYLKRNVERRGGFSLSTIECFHYMICHI